jgi:glycosyltransferase involved in cell wall biosynthesis
MMIEIVFWASLALAVYAYVGYPVMLRVLTLFSARDVLKGEITPSVTFIVAAYNEEKRIAAKLENTLQLSYPDRLIEIVVASDCSTDGTDQIVRSFESRGVKLVRAPKRRGKEAAQKLAVQMAEGEILVFSDVATRLPENAVRNIVRNFNDPAVGCVSSVDRFVDKDGKISGEGAYVKYEMWLRSLEARVNSLVGLSGSFFAARSTVCKQAWSEDLQSDFNTVLNSMKMGLRGVSDNDSVGYYENIADERKEFNRKVRTVLRGISVFMRSLAMINPLRYPLFSWQLMSHKLCRWLVPFAMLGVLVSSALLSAASPLYRGALAAQLAFYLLAVAGLLFRPWLRFSIIKLPAFFVLVNASILQAWLRYFGGERLVAWEPSRR